MNDKKLILKEPIKFGSETITELVFIKPKAKHMRGMPQAPGVSECLDLAGRLCGQPSKAMDELSIPDMNEVMGVIASFLGNGPVIGSEP